MMARRKLHTWHYIAITLVLVLGTAGVLSFLGWSFWPFGKRHLPDYYFIQLHEHHKNYVPEGKRLVVLNGVPVDSLNEKQRIGIAKATRIIEYSSAKALEQFGEAGRYGATEIIGEEAEWIISDSPIYKRRPSPAMLLTHTNVPLPNRMNPGRDAILMAGELTDTLYLGTVRYRHVVLDTIEKVMVTPSRFFYANAYKRKKVADRQLLVFRYGRQEASFNGVELSGSGERAYAYDDRVVDFGRWVDNTVSTVMKRGRKSGKVNDVRLLVVNGKVLKGERTLSRVQATRGTVVYLNGIEAVQKYGMRGCAGAIEVTGNSVRFFAQQGNSSS